MIIDITADHVLSLLPSRPADGHKGTFGHLAVIAGSRGFAGACKLTALGASRSGVGLVTACIPESIADAVAAGLLEQMTHPLPATGGGQFSEDALEPALQFLAGRDAAVVGPGMGQVSETQAFVVALLESAACPMVVDADGLNIVALAARNELLNGRIATPHPGEMARLAGCATGEVQANRAQIARDFSAAWDCVLVLKGYGTLIATPSGALYRNTTGNAGLASGGTGDLLAGLMGGLLAQGMDPESAAVAAVWIHGRAGDLAAADLTQRGMMARDVLDAIPRVWAELENP